MREELDSKRDSGTKGGSSGETDSIKETSGRKVETPAVGGSGHSADELAQTDEQEKISPHDFVVRYNPSGY